MAMDDTQKQQRAEQYQAKRAAILKQCEICRSQNHHFPPTAERCYHCNNGQRMRYLENEYSDVTGWSHEQWQAQKP